MTVCGARAVPVTLTAAETRLRLYLTYLAAATAPSRHACCRTYGQVSDAVPEGGWRWKRYSGLGEALDHVNAWEAAHGRPLLSVLVVLAGDGHPSWEGFVPSARAHAGADIRPGSEHAAWLDLLAATRAYWAVPR